MSWIKIDCKTYDLTKGYDMVQSCENDAQVPAYVSVEYVKVENLANYHDHKELRQ